MTTRLHKLLATGMPGAICALVVLAGSAPLPAAEPAELPLALQESFDKGADRWQPTDAAAWKTIDTPKGKAYSLFQKSNYQPPHRSPLNFSLLKDVKVGDFVLEAKVQSTTRQYDHRDACLVFGYQDAAHFYYVHFGRKTDDHANQIFIVDGKPRSKISTKTTPGTNWDDEWHAVKLVRNVGSGSIDVFFDDMKTPVMTASDKTFGAGLVGLGSFDDTANFAQVVLRGKPESRPAK